MQTSLGSGNIVALVFGKRHVLRRHGRKDDLTGKDFTTVLVSGE
jgi:hypothetical protein